MSTILTLNAGSSSIKFAAFTADPDPRLLWRGQIDPLDGMPNLTIWEGGSKSVTNVPPMPSGRTNRQGMVAFLLEIIAERASQCLAVGHRVVHGGTSFDRPIPIDPAVLSQIEALSTLAPSHQPYNVAVIRAALAMWPAAQQVACFDTAFHRTIPESEQLYAIPYTLAAEGVRRYGFHGLSYESIVRQLPRHLGKRARGRIVVAHLGSGASLCGLVDGESRATTMGFTPLDGLVMGRRPGRLDPGVLLFLMEEKGFTPAELSRFLNRECGLLGLSGISADMRELLADGSRAACRATDSFVSRLVAEIGAVAASIGGIEALVFTGGIGENSSPIRQRAVERIYWLGARLDAARNGDNETFISSAESKLPILVLPSDEERVIALHAYAAVSR